MVVPVYVGLSRGRYESTGAVQSAVRLGRAVGAYHSAHTTTPDDLRTLVTTGYISRNELLESGAGQSDFGVRFPLCGWLDAE